MMKELPPSYDYQMVAKILDYSLRTVQQIVYESGKPNRKIKLEKVQGDGMLPRITHESVVKAYAVKYGVGVDDAEERVRKEVEKIEKENASRKSGKASKLSETFDGSNEHSVASGTESNEAGEYYNNSVSSVVSSETEENHKIINYPKADANGVSESRVWMYSFPFDDHNNEFGIAPSEFMNLGSVKDCGKRLDFIADSFMKDEHVVSVLASFCRSEAGYYHFHVIVMFDIPKYIRPACAIIGNGSHVIAVQKTSLQRTGERQKYRDPLQGMIDYITKSGRFEGSKVEECLLTVSRGEALFKSARAEKALAAQEDTNQINHIIRAIKNGKPRKEILALYPSYNYPGGIEKIRTIQQQERFNAMGRHMSRRVRTLLVIGDNRCGKTESVNSTLKRFRTARISASHGLEEYESQRVLIIDRPAEHWCPYDLLIKMLSSSITTIPVRTQGSTMTLWDSVVIEANSISELLNGYEPMLHSVDRTAPTNVSDLLKYVDIVRYCFLVETRKLLPTLYHDEYSQKPVDGFDTRYDYIDIPVVRGHFRSELDPDVLINDGLIKRLAYMFFDVTKTSGETASVFENVTLSAEEIEIEYAISEALCNGFYIVNNANRRKFQHENFIPLYKEVCKRIARMNGTSGENKFTGPDL